MPPATQAVSDADLSRLSLQQHPQDVLALFRIPQDNDAPSVGSELSIALDGVQDPGNLGTIIRVADWFGIKDIWCSENTVDVFNPKVVQATMGGLARVKVHYVNLPQTLKSLPEDMPIYGTSLEGSSLWEADITPQRGVIVMGNEGNGVTPEVSALCTHSLLIPNYPPESSTTESLNVGVATSIVLAEFRRRAMKALSSLASVASLITVATLLSLTSLAAFTSCSSSKFLGDDEKLLNKVSISCEDKDVPIGQLSGYVRQHPNARWFSLFKVPLGIYCISSTDSASGFNRFVRRLGEAPVVYDSLTAVRSQSDLEAAVRNLGFLNANVDIVKKEKGHKLNLDYVIQPNDKYHVDTLAISIDDPALDSIYDKHRNASLLRKGMVFDVNVLDRERSRITTLFLNEGYYQFTKSLVSFAADTTRGNNMVGLTLHIPLYRSNAKDTLRNHQRFYIGKVNIHIDSTTSRLRPSFLASKTEIQTGQLYREQDAQTTYDNLSSLSAVLGTHLTFTPSATAPDTLDADIGLVMARRHSVSTEVEGTNSAGDFGAAVSLSYENRNLFRRSASLGITLRGAYEAISGLEGYNENNYLEYSTEAELKFPEFRFPFLGNAFRHKIRAQSIAAVMYDSQDRPEFHRRVLTAAWRYRINSRSNRVQHRIDLADLDYVFMPWISETFHREYLDDVSSRNAILRYNYENLFIMRWGYTFRLTNLTSATQNSYGLNAYSLRLSVETAGNLLRAMSGMLHAQYSEGLDAYTLFNIAYAQYAKMDIDFAKSFRIDSRNSAAMHFAWGMALPYGNSSILPYEKRYFAGGANSVRGWAVRGLGPGSFSGTDGRIDFIHQTGDMRLDASVEWRTHLFWKLDGAAFVDAGNVWTLRNYEEQPGGQFRFDKFWEQIAVAYGIGLRFNFGYFIIRLDGGMKAIDPAHPTGKKHYPVVNPNFSRDFHLHFAVGLPY